MEASRATHEIVFGSNGSENAERALHGAIDEARLRAARVRIVTAWHVPLALNPRPDATPPASSSLEDDVRHAAESIAASAVMEVKERGNLPVETKVVKGDVAEVLIYQAEDADLLVVGSGRRGYSGLLAGSVSIERILHARPTRIVH